MPRVSTTTPDEAARNRAALQTLMSQHALTAAGVAALLAKATHRPVGASTVRSWLLVPAAKTSQP
ncbi:hypothetical protein P7L87_26380, partial [Vibrio parahaemolyticus]|nr:hypothetical protein [Vibrio parahaemolyticus]